MKTRCFKLFLFLILVVAMDQPCFAQNPLPSQIFLNAADFYKQAKYNRSITEYEKILKAGLENGTIYYNLGNCYFKTGELGKSILNYERARRLIPRDRDLAANYNYAQSLIKGTVLASRPTGVKRLFIQFFGQFSLDDLTIFLSLVCFLIMAVLTFGIYQGVSKQKALLSLVILVLFFVVAGVNFKYRISNLNSEAVVVINSSEVKFAPLEHATVHFTIYEGMKIRIMLFKNNWCKVVRADGKTGWVPSSSLELI